MLIVENRSKTRKPDFWLLCMEDFTEDELIQHRGIMRKLRIKVLPHGVKCRIDRLHSKEAILEFLKRSKSPKSTSRETGNDQIT